MPVFSYIARNSQGDIEKGEISGSSVQDVVAELKLRYLHPIKLDEKIDKEDRQLLSIDIFSKSMKKKKVAIFARQFSTMMSAGVPLSLILDVLIKQERSSAFIETMKSINTDVMTGNSLSQSMKRTKAFSPLVVSMVEVGEASGRLDMAFDKIAVSLEKEVKLASKVKGAMVYPAILFITSIIAYIILTFFVLPIFGRMFAAMNAPMPPLTSGIMGMSSFMGRNWSIIPGALAVILFIIIFVYNDPELKSDIDRLLLKLPMVGKLQRTILMARFCRNFSSLSDSGVSLVQSLEIIKGIVRNTHVKKGFDEIISDVQAGSSISQAASSVGIFTPLVISMIRVGEESGKLGEVMSKTAEIYEEESEAGLQQVTSMIEPAITLLMALGVGTVVLSIVQPMFSMYSFFTG